MGDVRQQQPQSQTLKKKLPFRGLFSHKDQNDAQEQREINSGNSTTLMHTGLANRIFRNSIDQTQHHLIRPQPIAVSDYNAVGGPVSQRTFPLASPGGQTISRKPLDEKGNGGEQLRFTSEETLARENEQLQSPTATHLESKEKWKRKYVQLDADYEDLRKELLQVSNNLKEKENDYKEADDDVKRKNNELRQLNLRHEEEKKKWERWAQTEKDLHQEIQELKSKLRTASEKQKQYYEQAQTERNHVEQLTNQYQDIGTSFQETSNALQIRTLELSQIQRDYQELQRIHGAASDELARIKLESKSTLDNQFFLEYWQGLQRDIKEWAETYFWGGAKRSNWMAARVEDQPVIHQKLLVLSPDCPNLLYKSEDGSGRALVAEAYLWKFIEEKVLDGNPKSFSQGFFWAHNLRAHLCRMEKFLRPREGSPDAELRMFYKWKASTAKLLISRLEPPSDRYRIPVDYDILDNMAGRILGVLDSSLMESNANLSSCRAGLRGILQSVIGFDSHVNEQWSSVYPMAIPHGYDERHGFPFSNMTMDAVSSSPMREGEYVGLVVSPALVRKGTANGDKYDEIEIVAKSLVLPQGFLSSTQKSKNSKTRVGQVMEGLYRR